VKDPLLGPLAAVALGIGLAHLVWFDLGQTLLAGALLAVLAMVAVRRSRRIALVAGLLALAFAGIAVDVARRPGPPPVIEAASDETLILSGCVVEPAVFYEDRDQFTL
jgi:hypothetical protein